ncbi:sulfatase-like hydrolase/transferase [Halapricum sp. CBA1109]|uniref:sulfatase family protein n=1 Tax=Halapricum sp. CBA1109 TaxID=2668068 RepID=UPI0012FCC40D|nr:sulfatase [Halapricum sp. CBA1109]MUV88794.1 sulfatase-like hydrolase/transferase [Halapricum sp. CBA1109]
MDAPNVVVLIADAVRPDFISCYGGETATPAIESLAERGTLFENAYAVGPNTSISHGGIFTGQYPSRSGVLGANALPADTPVLGEWFADAGYDTFGIPGPAKMGSAYGYDRGFDEYFETYTGDKPPKLSTSYLSTLFRDPTLRGPLLRDFLRTAFRGPDSLTQLKFDILQSKIERELTSPFFALLNTTIAHTPYNPPRPYKETATPELRRPRWYVLEHLFGDERVVAENVRSDRLYDAQTTDGIAQYLADPSYLNDSEMDILRRWYRAGIKYFDDVLGTFLDWIENNTQNTIVVVMSDHGENFGERGLIVHSHLLHDEVLHVPLVIAGPGVPEGERRSDLVSLVDLFETVCDLTGIDAPGTTDGQSMFDTGKRDAVFAEYGSRYEEQGGHTKYMSSERYEQFRVGRKQIRTEQYRFVVTSAGEEFLYRQPSDERVEDPEESVVSRLRDRLFETLSPTFKTGDENVELDAGSRSNLRDLGYLE